MDRSTEASSIGRGTEEGDSSPRPVAQVMCAHLNGETVLLQMDQARYFRLNETGQVIWEGLEAGLSPAEVSWRLADLFEVDLEEARAALDTFLKQLMSQRLIEC